MERYVLLVFTLLCIYVTFSYAEETKEETISVSHLESQPNVCMYVYAPLNQNLFTAYLWIKIYTFLLTEFEGRTVGYRPSFFPIDLWSKREPRRP